MRGRVAALSVLLLLGALGPPAGAADPEVVRRFGSDRFATAAAISAANFEPGPEVVYVATGEQFPDALAAGPVAAARRAPLLLVASASLPGATSAELRRLKPESVVVLGGAGAVSQEVADRIATETGADVSRVAGRDSYETAAALAEGFEPGVEAVLLARGDAFPDALAGVAAAPALGGPVLLVAPDRIPASTGEQLQRLRPRRVLVLGGTGAISHEIAEDAARMAGAPVQRLAGRERFATSAEISRAAFPDGADTVYIATG